MYKSSFMSNIVQAVRCLNRINNHDVDRANRREKDAAAPKHREQVCRVWAGSQAERTFLSKPTVQEESSHLVREEFTFSVYNSLPGCVTLRLDRQCVLLTNGGKSLNWTDCGDGVVTIAAAAPPAGCRQVEARRRLPRGRRRRWRRGGGSLRLPGAVAVVLVAGEPVDGVIRVGGRHGDTRRQPAGGITELQTQRAHTG